MQACISETPLLQSECYPPALSAAGLGPKADQRLPDEKLHMVRLHLKKVVMHS